MDAFLNVSRGERVQATLEFENEGIVERLQNIAVTAHSYPEPPPEPKTGLIVGVTLGATVLVCGICTVAILLAKKKKCCKKAAK